MPQQPLFELNGARVASGIASFGDTSYQIANIGSVRVERRKRINPLTIILLLFGLGIVVAAFVQSRTTGAADAYFSMAITGVAVMLAAFLLQLVWPGRAYALVFRICSGEVDALVSRDQEFISNIQKAVEQAFSLRAGQLPANET